MKGIIYVDHIYDLTFHLYLTVTIPLIFILIFKFYKVIEYVQNLSGNEILVDKLAKKEFQQKVNAADIFPPHLTMVEIDKGIKEGRFHQGTFRASRDNFLEGSINLQSFDEDVCISHTY